MSLDEAKESIKSSSQILDEIFLELQEKTSTGEIAVTDLARLIAQVQSLSSDSEEEEEASEVLHPISDNKKRKRHKHKHKKSKKHKRKHKHKRNSDNSDEKVDYLQSCDGGKAEKVETQQIKIENNEFETETDTKVKREAQDAHENRLDSPISFDTGTVVKGEPQDVAKSVNGEAVEPAIEEGEIGDEEDRTLKRTKRKCKRQKGVTSKVLKSSIVCVSESDSVVKCIEKKKKKKKKRKKEKLTKRFTSPLTLDTSSCRRIRRHRRSYSRFSSTSASSRSRSCSRDSSSRGYGRRSESPRSGRSRRSCSREWKRTSSRSLSPSEVIDKAKLLEIARKNAMAMIAQGKLPMGLPVPLKSEEPVFRPGGKSVAELTDFCKLISKNESEESETGNDGTKTSSEDGKTTFLHHPFKPRERPPDIVVKIRNAVQIPTRTQAEKVAESSTKLRIQFPVSSGTQHRKKEFEWVPVSPDKEQIDKLPSPCIPNTLLALPAPPLSPHPAALPEDNVFPEQLPVVPQFDIGSIVSQRLQAVRKLMDNPHDVVALGQMFKSQKEMQYWAQSKQLPGQFTGTTDATILTPQQLAGPAHSQAWVRKDQFSRATPVQSGFGMHMLQRMGWKPGEGLGRNKEGPAEPLILDIKMDKKGLVSQDEIVRKTKLTNIPIVVKDLSGKHPVSALGELCSKRRWSPPEYTVVFDGGPEHKKNFVFKVKVNGAEYQPTIASLNKKHAKAQSATVCLQALGLVPRDLNNPL